MKQTLQKPILFNCKFLMVMALTAVFSMVGMSLYAQERTISGQVTANETGLPGVSILEKGTSNGTTSDSDGNFRLTVNTEDAVLIFSFIGYQTQELAVGGRTQINVAMAEEATALNEVVVTALGVQREVKSLGYSVQKVEGKGMTKAREPNVINSLTGRVAGLQIKNQTDLFQDPQISLRGSTPLIVIDGVPSVDADIWKLNADDIESYSVLKGATASALYGSIGRHGAIMITTKRGSGDGPTRVEINSSTLFQPSFIRIPEVQTTYGNGNNGQYTFVDGSGGGLEGGGWIWGPKLDQLDPSTPSGYWETTQFNSPVDPATGQLIPLPFLSRGRNNVKDFFRTGLISTNNISVSGSSENGSFRISTSHAYQKGIVPNTDLKNTSFQISGGYKLSKKLKSDASLTYNRQYTDNFPERGYGPNNYLYNLILWTGPDVDVNDLETYWKPGQEGLQQRHYNTSWYNNPHFQANEYLRGYYRDNVFGQVKLDYNVLPGLDLTLRTGLNQFSLNRTYKEPKSYIAYDYVSNGNFMLSTENEMNINTDFIAQYVKQFSENFTIRASAGGANRWSSVRWQEQGTDGLIVPEFFNLSNSANPLRGRNSMEEQKVNSVYGTLDFEFFGGIFLGVTGRNDWVSTVPVKNNSFFYPSVSLAAVISDFTDLSSAKISFLKLRGSWSKVSDGQLRLNAFNRGTYPYQHVQAYSPGINWNNTPSLRYPSLLLNPDIKPETSDTYEVGADVRFLEGRLGLDVALYRIRDYNNIAEPRLSAASGYTNRLINAGEFLRKGVEVTLSGTPIKSGLFSWDVTLNWSNYHRYLKTAYDSTGRIGYIREGQRWDQIYGFSYLYTPGGRLVLGDNGFPQQDPYSRMLGHEDPDYIFGLQNAFTFKDFSLMVSVDGRVGGKMYSSTNQKMWWGGTHPGTVNQYRDDANEGLATYIADGVTIVEGAVEYDVDGNIVSDSRVYAPNTTPVNYISWNINTSNAYLNHYYDATFVKLREVTLTYNLPSAFLSRTFLSQASVSLVGRNLLLWSDMPEVDPDPGEDSLQTPSVRNIGFNVNLIF
jgi:TonB-linked SusC/RagA family outer membrane protein